jgi:hypothetical protein
MVVEGNNIQATRLTSEYFRDGHLARTILFNVVLVSNIHYSHPEKSIYKLEF